MRARTSIQLLACLCVGSTLSVSAQEVPGPPHCGTELSPAAQQLYGQVVAQHLGAALPMAPGAYSIPLTVHVVRRSDGTGGINPAQLGQALEDANTAFAPMNISFCQLGPTIYIDSDAFYYDIDTWGEFDSLKQTAVVPGTINCYFTENMVLPSDPDFYLCGVSSYPGQGVQGIIMRNACSGVPEDAATFAHELAHYFWVVHTHDGAAECPDGSNCDVAGDLLCDTAADPKLGDFNVNGACQFVGDEPVPCGGEPYDPPIGNFMSYSPKPCRDHFTPQQQQIIVGTLITERTELIGINCGGAPQNNSCANALPIADGDSVFSTILATSDGPSHQSCGLDPEFFVDVWYDYVAPCDGVLNVSVCGADAADANVAVYDQCSCPLSAFDLLGCDITGACAEVNGLFATAGQCFKIRVFSFFGATGVGSITVDCDPILDDCDDGLVLSGSSSYNLSFNTNGAETDGPAHNSCGMVSNDIWFDVQASCDGNLIVSTCGTAEFDTKVAIYEGIDCPVTSDRLLNCSDDHPTCPGDTTFAAVPVLEGQWYKVRLGGDSEDAEGTGSVNILCEPGPSNDYCDNAALTFLGVPTPFDTDDATTDGPAIPYCGFGSTIFRDVWFVRPATCTGQMTVSTCGADFLTKVAVYEGSECPVTDDRLLGCSNFDDECPQLQQGRVTVDVTEGAYYLIRVGGINQTGQGELVFECESILCPEDVNGDGLVDVLDMVAVIVAWGPCAGCAADLNGDNVVDVQDLVSVVIGWGACG